jgi:hypothetical protein
MGATVNLIGASVITCHQLDNLILLSDTTCVKAAEPMSKSADVAENPLR